MQDNQETSKTIEVMGQAYQVIAAIAHECGLVEHAEVQRALDYFSQNAYCERFLPFSLNRQNTTRLSEDDQFENSRGRQ